MSVCTNVTCLVTGGPEILEKLETRYALDDDVTVEEVECLAACGGAPSMQVNYEFHEKLTPEMAETLGGGVQVGQAHGAHGLGIAASPSCGSGRLMAFSEERRIVTKRLHERPDDSWTIDGALASGAYDVCARRSPRATRPTCRNR